MRSSRMRTVSCSGRVGDGVSAGGCLPGVCVSATGQGCACMRGGCTLNSPPVNQITDRRKNITFPQLRLQTAGGNVLHLYVILFPGEGVLCPGESWGVSVQVSVQRGLCPDGSLCQGTPPRDTPCTVEKRPVHILLD